MHGMNNINLSLRGWQIPKLSMKYKIWNIFLGWFWIT